MTVPVRPLLAVALLALVVALTVWAAAARQPRHQFTPTRLVPTVETICTPAGACITAHPVTVTRPASPRVLPGEPS